MSSDVYSKPDLSKKVRYSRSKEEDNAGWEMREVDIYENFTDNRSKGEEQQTQKNAALKKGPVRGATLFLGVVCIMMTAVIIILSTYYVSVSLAKDHLQTENNRLNSSYWQLHIKLSGKWCPEGWSKFGCSCYNKSTEKKSWSDSRRDCQERGADLVIINSKEEQEFVRKLNMDGTSWIGMELNWLAQQQKYEWKWVDGSPLTTTFWADGWPKDDLNVKYAVCSGSEGRWEQLHYIDTTKWICEK